MAGVLNMLNSYLTISNQSHDQKWLKMAAFKYDRSLFDSFLDVSVLGYSYIDRNGFSWVL